MNVGASTFNSSIGQDQFLKLMAAQMANQNPLEPTSQEDFLGQLAQFSTLSGIEQLNANFEGLFRLQSLTQGASLVGREVEYFSATSNSNKSGVIESARVVNQNVVLTIGGVDVSLNDVVKVMGNATAAE
ncbi:flagellar hook assembly protein FlgD [Planctomicrobium sp. SH668]|uniref:flagellar hook assembly protein FlgD n=1 Tax=Planctomicrobium sp. SH668 TaxID=3448126 RepID=UPI003F5C7D47